VRVPNGGFHRRAARLLGGRSLGGYRPVLHVVAFTRRGLVAAVGRAGLRVQSLKNSPFAVTPTSGLAGRLLPRLLSAAAALVALVSGGAWLIAPSLILHAERPVRRPELEATR
jgi:hypothetical protein